MSTRAPRGVPAVAIIDTRNVVGQAEEVLGVRRNPSGGGVHRALAMYGFEVKKVVAIVATLSSGKMTPSLARALQLNRTYARLVRSSGGVVYEARLQAYRGGMEEKEADVFCARAIAEEVLDIVDGRSPARDVIVISRDSDLTPMFAFADQRAVPIYSAAASVVHDRPNDWILLTESAIRTLTGARAGLGGHAARDAVAEYAYRSWAMAASWTVVGTIKRNGLVHVLVQDSAGIRGTISPAALPGGSAAPRQVHRLFPVGVDLGERFREFPYVKLAATPGALPAADLEEAVITGVPRPTEVALRLADGSHHKVHAPLGGFTKGRRVLVARRTAVQLVGALEPCPTPAFVKDALAPIIVEVTDVLRDRTARVRCPNGTVARLIVHDKPVLKVGERRAAMLIDVGAATQEPVVIAISSTL